MVGFRTDVAGGAAALAGLLFVGRSLNLADVLRHPGVPARAAATLSLTISILLVTIFLATPGQSLSVLAVEIGGLGALMGAGSLWAGRHQGRGRSLAFRAYTLLFLLVPSALFVVAGASLLVQRGGGLYWVTAGVVAGFLSASANSWVLLVEIKR